MEQLRTRIAPTPSGLLHPGNGLSFLLTWAMARAQGGTVLLRIDDLDKERYRPAYVEDIFRTLDWLGIDYDEGPSDVRDFEQNWSQHLRLDNYKLALDQLREQALVFACDCSRKQIRAASPDGRYPNTCQNRGLDMERGDVAWRIRPPVVTDRVEVPTWQQGKLPIGISDLDAFVVRQKNGLPAYQLASLLDDERYDINFIVRGQDLWASSLSQLYLAGLLEKTSFLGTQFHHHSLLLNDEGQKLSKSKGAGSLQAWREAGKSPAELVQLAVVELGLRGEFNTVTDLVEGLKEHWVKDGVK